MKAIPARFAGRCCVTGTEYEAGALIVKTGDRWELVTVGGRPVVLDGATTTEATEAPITPADATQRPGPCALDARSYRTAPNFTDPTFAAGIVQAGAMLLCQLMQWCR